MKNQIIKATAVSMLILTSNMYALSVGAPERTGELSAFKEMQEVCATHELKLRKANGSTVSYELDKVVLELESFIDSMGKDSTELMDFKLFTARPTIKASHWIEVFKNNEYLTMVDLNSFINYSNTVKKQGTSSRDTLFDAIMILSDKSCKNNQNSEEFIGHNADDLNDFFLAIMEGEREKAISIQGRYIAKFADEEGYPSEVISKLAIENGKHLYEKAFGKQ